MICAIYRSERLISIACLHRCVNGTDTSKKESAAFFVGTCDCLFTIGRGRRAKC